MGKGKVGIVNSPRNRVRIGIREMSKEEFFQKTYIIGKVPSSVTMDMRLAIMDRRANARMEREWSPYLTSTSRWLHRKNLKWMDHTNQLDYYRLRDDWIQRYDNNLDRRVREARLARGLSPLKSSTL